MLCVCNLLSHPTRRSGARQLIYTDCISIIYSELRYCQGLLLFLVWLGCRCWFYNAGTYPHVLDPRHEPSLCTQHRVRYFDHWFLVPPVVLPARSPRQGCRVPYEEQLCLYGSLDGWPPGLLLTSFLEWTFTQFTPEGHSFLPAIGGPSRFMTEVRWVLCPSLYASFRCQKGWYSVSRTTSSVRKGPAKLFRPVKRLNYKKHITPVFPRKVNVWSKYPSYVRVESSIDVLSLRQ